MATVYIGIGSNLGDRQKNIDDALDMLKKYNITVNRISSIIETDPIGGPVQDKFLNAVAKLTTELDPHTLLEKLNTIEKNLGRKRTILNGPRTIDLDILLYDNISLTTNNLVIPHPRMFKRDFVLKPLREIADKAVKKHYADI